VKTLVRQTSVYRGIEESGKKRVLRDIVGEAKRSYLRIKKSGITGAWGEGEPFSCQRCAGQELPQEGMTKGPVLFQNEKVNGLGGGMKRP